MKPRAVSIKGRKCGGRCAEKHQACLRGSQKRWVRREKGKKKEKPEVQLCLDGMWELWGGEAEAQGRAEAGEGISGAQKGRGCAAELGHAECRASRTRMHGWHRGAGEVAGTGPWSSRAGGRRGQQHGGGCATVRSGTGMGWSRMGAAPGELTMVTLGKGWQELQQMRGKAVPWQGQRDNTGQSRA